MGQITKQVCNAIISELSDELIVLNEENWINVSNGFNFKWQLPNCLGAIDGKHIAIRKPFKSGTEYYNYKRFFSIILMAVVDASYRFISIDVGGKGAEGDSGIFSRTELGKMIKSDDPELYLPPNAIVGPDRLPYFFIADDAFPLMKRIMKPYTPKRRQTLTEEEAIFNYRLSRARRCVENAFGILVSKWACTGKTFHSKPQNVQIIVAACCLLHNFMINQQSESYIPTRYRDSQDTQGQFVDAAWRNDAQNNLTDLNDRTYEPSREAEHIRDKLKNFVNSVGSLSFQRRAGHLEI